MFEDLGEQQHVFSLLDEWANDQTNSDLTYQTGSKSKFNDEIKKLINAIESEELETIKKNPKLRLGFSYQSELLAKLWLSLTSSNTPPKLLANLSDIKILLLQAMVISNDVKYDKLKLSNEGMQADANLGKVRKLQVRAWSKKGADTVKKYTDTDHKNWLKQADDLKEKNCNLSVRGIANTISKADKNNPKSETVRKYLSKNWVMPSNKPS